MLGSPHGAALPPGERQAQLGSALKGFDFVEDGKGAVLRELRFVPQPSDAK